MQGNKICRQIFTVAFFSQKSGSDMGAFTGHGHMGLKSSASQGRSSHLGPKVLLRVVGRIYFLTFIQLRF